MKLRAFTSLFLAVLFYTVSVIIGLINKAPLLNIFLNGIIYSFLTFILVYFIIFLMESMADKARRDKDKEEQESQDISTDNNLNNAEQNRQLNQEDGIEGTDNRAAEDFSPLSPPRLEVEQEQERGEGS